MAAPTSHCGICSRRRRSTHAPDRGVLPRASGTPGRRASSGSTPSRRVTSSGSRSSAVIEREIENHGTRRTGPYWAVPLMATQDGASSCRSKPVGHSDDAHISHHVQNPAWKSAAVEPPCRPARQSVSVRHLISTTPSGCLIYSKSQYPSPDGIIILTSSPPGKTGQNYSEIRARSSLLSIT
jgi:hypothetical protein